MSDKQPTCRLCLSDRLSVCLTLPHASRSIQRLLEARQLPQDHPLTLRVHQCGACGFVQLTERLEEDYYDDYVMTTSHSPQMVTYQRAQAEDFVARFGLAGRHVVEVGCGDGNYLALLQAAGAIGSGVEPSDPFRRMALARGLDVAGGYVGRGSRLAGAPFDAFVTRQVLEHVPDPNDFLQGIRENLVANGVGLVEVPSLEQAMEHGRFYDFFADHLNYFSSVTLRHALERNGIIVLDTSRGMNGEYNVALVQRAPAGDFAGLQNTLITLSRDLRAYIEACAKAGKRVAIWGAGGKGVTAMAVADVSGVAYVVDSDPRKAGYFTPVTHLRICAPEQLMKEPVEAVIVTALAYRDEIITQLRQTLGFTGEVAVLGPTLEFLDRRT
jgi:SAM-dependent methyltransferase